MIRIAKSDDLASINHLGVSLHDNFEKLFHIETEINSEYAIVIVSENSGKIDGFLYAVSLVDNIDLLSIVVDINHRGKKIGSLLLEYLIANYVKDQTITLEVDVNNVVALSLYKKYGFVVENIRKGYYNGVDAYLMKRGVK